MTEDTPKPKVDYDEFGFVRDYLCPYCSGKLKLDHEDDIGTSFYKCEKCNQQTAKPKPSMVVKEQKVVHSWKEFVEWLYDFSHLDKPTPIERYEKANFGAPEIPICCKSCDLLHTPLCYYPNLASGEMWACACHPFWRGKLGITLKKVEIWVQKKM